MWKTIFRLRNYGILNAPLGQVLSTVVVIMLMTAAFALGEPETVQDVSKIINEQGEVGEMSKGLSTTLSILIILIPVILCLIFFVWVYNDIVNKEEEVIASWSDVESNYQRRADLVPNLVETVKGYAAHEQSVLIEVTKSRQAAVEAMLGMEDKLGDEAALSEAAQAQKALGANITRLFAVVENYPQLRSADSFLALQDQLEGTENRINVARMAFNESVREYNSTIRKMPGTLIAGMGGFQRKAYFQADDGTEKPVDVSF